MADYYCEKCKKTMDEKQFYSSNNLDKYPDGKLTPCKKCITMHVDNWDPQTYLWILEEADVPYVPSEWHKLMLTYAKDKSKVTGMTIVGRYLSKMRLNQFNKYRWADSEFLQEIENHKIEEAMRKKGMLESEIVAVVKESSEMPEVLQAIGESIAADKAFAAREAEFAAQATEEIDVDLTDEDRTYLKLKWGKTYRPEQWVKLEQLYEEFMNSYDIQTAGHIDTLKMICKTSLKANELLDLGDVEGFQKLSKVYNDLMKAGKFTAAQDKSEHGEFVDSVSELVAICEKDGFIPRYYVEEPNDKVDKVILDGQRYVRNLVMEELNLGELIEKAIKEIQIQKEKDALNAENDIDEDEEFEEELFVYENEEEISEEDYEEFREFNESLGDDE